MDFGPGEFWTSGSGIWCVYVPSETTYSSVYHAFPAGFSDMGSLYCTLGGFIFPIYYTTITYSQHCEKEKYQ